MTVVRTRDTAPLQVLSDQVRLLLRSAQSPHQMSVMVVDVPPGGAVPPHRHGQEEEGYFVLAGRLELTLGAAVHTLAPGDFGHVPAGVVHAYRNPHPVPVRFLAWTVGGPIDRFFKAMSQRVHRMPDDAAAMAEVTAQFGVQMVDGRKPDARMA